MKVVKIKEILQNKNINEACSTQGWVRTFRANRFIALNDGSTLDNLQCVVDFEKLDEKVLKQINTGAAIQMVGKLVESKGNGQNLELKVEKLNIIGISDPKKYPIQPKKHSLEFLRDKAHLRIRTSTFSAVMRVRSALSFAIHKFFNKEGFHYVSTPIITGSDAEGAGEMFHVSTLSRKNPPLKEDGKIDYKQDFFAKETK